MKENGSFTRINLIGMNNHVKQHILNRNPRETQSGADTPIPGWTQSLRSLSNLGYFGELIKCKAGSWPPPVTLTPPSLHYIPQEAHRHSKDEPYYGEML